MIGSGAFLLSGYPLKMFLEPFLIFTVWFFLIVLPIMLSPLSTDDLILVLAFSLLALTFLYGGYTKLREKRKKKDSV